MPIKILPPEIASQIAAGEVIERPASVVKELLENALDAKASNIIITVEGAGKRLIEVADDGCGIPADELQLALARHSTSKLSHADDLFSIQTLGFRGEAIASIASVSRFTITSRVSQADTGAKLRVEGGQAGAVNIVGVPVGTVVRVEDLFYNVPARLKFLKSERTEKRQIDNLVTRYALAYPEVRFRLEQDKRTALQTNGTGDYREVLAALFGLDIARQMLEVIAEDDDLGIKGFISPTTLTRSNRRDILFFVNGRPIRDIALTTALVQAYHTLLMVGRFPMAVLFLEVSPTAVDVNVHPTKAEVRFREANRIFVSIQNAVRRALLAHTPVPELGGSLGWRDSNEARGLPLTETLWAIERRESMEKSPGEEQIEADTPTAHSSQISGLRTPLLRLVGQVATTYLIAEGPDGLYLIDQHAAHERVLFEKFMSQRGEQIPSQSLLQPETVELSPSKARLLEEQLPALNRLGFSVEPFGPGTFLVRALPSLLANMDPAAAIEVLVEDFEEDETPLQTELEAKVIARVCKRAAVKAGQTLSGEEQRSLLEGLEACEVPRTCPHGRPTMIHLSVELLERQFGRRGAR